MTKEKAITIIESHKAHWQRLLREKICDEIEGRETIEGFDMAISALSAEPCRTADDYENEIADLHNRLDIAEYDKERYKEEITTLKAENKGEWIPVSERLPENSDYVLVTDGLDMFVAWHNPEKERFKGWHSFDELFDLQTPIVAWQPLPEPYKADREVSE